MSDKSVLQEWPTRVSYKSVPQDCPTRVSHKGVLQEGSARVSHKGFRKECVLQECPTRVSPTRVFVFEYMFAIGLVSSILFFFAMLFENSSFLNFCFLFESLRAL